MAMVFIWFAMIIALFKRLKSRHLSKYREMGEPSLFWNNSMRTVWTTLKYLFKREHKNLNDNSLSLLTHLPQLFLKIVRITSEDFAKVASIHDLQSCYSEKRM